MQRTPEQEKFIKELCSGASSIQLNAVAGSGKTTTIIMGLEESPVEPSSTLLLAFNVKIKEELARRAPRGTNVLTLNGLGHRAWGKYLGRRAFLDARKVGTIVSELCQSDDKEKRAYLSGLWPSVKDLTCKAKAAGLLPSQFNTGKGLVPDDPKVWAALASQHGIDFSEDILRMSRAALVKSTTLGLAGQIDFDDQLYLPACFRANLDKYSLVIVDEAQDLSEIQHFLIARAVAKDGRIVSVGDPCQAIYGFRGASADSMRELAEKFQSKELELTCTFRCSKAATRLAQKYVPHIQAAEGNLEGEVQRWGTEWSPADLEEGSVVLCRNIAPLVKLGMHCIKQGISAYVAGRDIGAPLKKAAKALNPLMNLHDAIIAWSQVEKARAQDNLETKARVNDITEALLAVAEVSGCEDSHALGETLVKLFAKTEGSITLSTIHRAKGLEWDTVYILDFWRIPQKWIKRIIRDWENQEDKSGASPHWMLTQEQNLAYIAITRTRDRLVFIDYPQTRITNLTEEEADGE